MYIQSDRSNETDTANDIFRKSAMDTNTVRDTGASTSTGQDMVKTDTKHRDQARA